MIAARLLSRLVAHHPVRASLLRIVPSHRAQEALNTSHRQFSHGLAALLGTKPTPAALLCRAQPAVLAVGRLAFFPIAAACGQMAHSGLSNGQLAAAGPTLTSEFLLRHDAANAQRDTVVVVLNWDLPMCTPRLMSAARMCICADGGANKLYDELPQRLPAAEPDTLRRQYAPHAITGDMDSARPEVLDFYRQHGADVVDLAEDQDSTDLHKCLAYIEKRFGAEELQRLTILVLGAMGGRIDHTLSNLNTLLTHSRLRIVLLGDASTARLLPAGACSIRPALGVEGPSCSLVPLAGPSVATSSGLKWNLRGTKMTFGGLISTSNVMVDDTVHVQSDLPLLWTTEFDDRP